MFGVWFVVQGGGVDPFALATSVCNYGMVPGELTHRAALHRRADRDAGLECVVDHNSINILTP